MSWWEEEVRSFFYLGYFKVMSYDKMRQVTLVGRVDSLCLGSEPVVVEGQV